MPKIADISPPAAEFFQVLLGTGMRFNELRSLPMSYLFAGQLDADDPLHKELTSQGIRYYGYIVFQSQADFPRSKDAPKLIRKPLKGRKTMTLKDARTIPIIDLEVYNILAMRYEKAEQALNAGVKGTEPIDYLLFEGLEISKAYAALLKAYVQLGKNPKQFHCTRHTYVTFMVGHTRSFFLVRAITGHKSRSFERYLHTFEEIAAKAKAKTTPVRVITLPQEEPKGPTAPTAWKWG